MVEQVIEEVAQSFEATWRERGELAEKVEALEKQIDQYRQREGLLTQTLVAAEQAASDVRERARREAETILLEAHSEARAVGREAHAERERLHLESKRIEGMLRAALGVIADGNAKPAPPEEPKAVAKPAMPVEPLVQVPVEPPVVAAAEPPKPAPLPELIVPPVKVEPAPIEKVLPPPIADEDLPGWPEERGDTAEFEPIETAEPAQVAPHEPAPEHDRAEEEPVAEHKPEPILERLSTAGSRDFDWGE